MCVAITSRLGGTSSIGIKLPSFSMQRRSRIPSTIQKKKKAPDSRLLRNEGGKETSAMFRVPEHRFFDLGRQIHVIVGGSRIKWPAGLHAACVRRECSACASNCRRLRPAWFPFALPPLHPPDTL